MSERNREGRRSARERLREEREKDRAREKRKRTLTMAGVVAVVLAVAGGVGATVSRTTGGSHDDGPVAAPWARPAGRAGDLVGRGEGAVDPDGVRGLPLPGLQAVRGHLPAHRARAAPRADCAPSTTW
ncbi:hypothetical protein NKH77_13845 [Streptomyces sp. M19]